MAKTKTQEPASASPCGCGTCRPSGWVGPGASAAGVDPEIKAANLKHLRRIEGQVRGIAAMVEQDRYCADIITQVASVQEALRGVARQLMRNHLKHCAATAIKQGEPEAQAMYDELLDLVYKHLR